MLLRCATLLSRLPIGVHHFIADWILFPIMFHMVRYRRKVVQKNLRLVFPDKDSSALKRMERAFYHQFCDTIVESVYGLTCSDEEMRQRACFENMEEVNKLLDQAGGGVLLVGHMANWDWVMTFPMWLNPNMKHLIVYKRIKNKAIDKLVLTMRSKRGGTCVDKKVLFKQTKQYHEQQQPFTIFIGGDQKPRPDAGQYPLTFLHQETGFFIGAEVLSKKYNLPVIYFHVERTQRGYYRIIPQVLTTTPLLTDETEITKSYAHALEQNIYEHPELWLWSHNRFKIKK